MSKGKCFKCNGTGKYNYGSNECWKCNGKGFILLPNNSPFTDQPKKQPSDKHE